MEQSDTLQIQGTLTDADAQAIQTTETTADQRVTGIAEDGQELSNTCVPSLKPMSVMETALHMKAESEDRMDASHDESKLDKPDVTICATMGQSEAEVRERAREKDTSISSQSQRLCVEEDQSLNVITIPKVVKAEKAVTDPLENDCNTVDDGHGRLDVAPDEQYPAMDSLKLESEDQTEDAHESAEETIREVHNNDDSQLDSLVVDTELSKLEKEEAVVAVVKTIPVITGATADDCMVTLDKKDNATSKECDRDTVLGLQEKKLVETDEEDREMDLLDYSQANDGAVIEVTEVIDAPIVETQREQQRNNKEENDAEAAKLTDGKIARDKGINGENREASMVDDKGDNNIAIIVDKKITITENDGCALQVTKDADFKITDSRENVVEETAAAAAEYEQEATLSCESSTAGSPRKKRSVIQDIFDDWGVENVDEDVQLPSKVQDSVEIELKSLLDETKTDQSESYAAVISSGKSEDRDVGVVDDAAADATGERDVTRKPAERAENQKRKRAFERDSLDSLDKGGRSSPPGHPGGRLFRGKQETRGLNSTPPPQSRVVSKNYSRHLTSQIATSAEVTEMLKQRLREKQKSVVDAPRGPDVFFVNKLTQRLSSRLAGNPKSPISGSFVTTGSQQASSLAHSSSSTSPSFASTPTTATTDNGDKRTTEASKAGNSDNKELLAILEGDDEPDWSVLNPPILTEEGRSPLNVEPVHNSPPKLDPLLERELALKQLLELPVKKTPARKRKTFQPAPGKVKDAVTRGSFIAKEDKVVDVDQSEKNVQGNPTESAEIRLCSAPRERAEGQNDRMPELMNMRAEESRSGRKRKLTEKAREHEQNTNMKRQKVYRGKVSLDKKQTREDSAEDNGTMKLVTMQDGLNDGTDNDDANNARTMRKETTDNKGLSEDEVEPIAKVDSFLVERSRANLVKKGPPMVKRRAIVKRLQKMPTSAKPVQLKGKLGGASRTKSSRVMAKAAQKRTSDGASGDAKPKKKSINEIDKLLQDEGVVNLLYDVEQPTKKRLVPITKSRAKVMDLQKVQRELKIRQKLVRNAVLRLRTPTTSAGVTKVSPRSKRTSAVQPTSDGQLDRRMVEQGLNSPRTSNSAASPTEFILPVKNRNAADASVIVRRHSSSSFSSASGSPRVSVDSPGERFMDTAKSTDDGSTHSLRSAKKKRDSQDDKVVNNAKRTKKRRSDGADDSSDYATVTSTLTISTTSSSDAVTGDAEEKVTTVPARPSKNVKKMEKIVGKQENISTLEDNVSSKVTTRSSNGAVMTGKVTAKSKRIKSKVSFIRANDTYANEESSKEEDKLSVCLAEAATALSVVSARSGNATVTRKSKANASTSRMDVDGRKTKVETQSQFSNKEINVRRHGNFVQLILTPSSSTRMKNALTLQVMQEFRQALSILKRDDECRVVLLTSTGTSFCEGLDLSTLLHANKEERRSVAQELAHAVKDFIKSLATFNKPIVAGVQGAAIGLGVTMLPLFDLIIASDKATFNTPYGKLGQIAEGAAVFTLSHILGSAITSELLLGGRTLTANEALKAGLVTRVLWPERFQVELLPALRAMSDQSAQSMEATKALLRHSLRKKLDAALESETYLLIQHWCSAECQTAIKAYIDGKIQ